MDAAFRNRDGSTALVVHNENDEPRRFAVAQGGWSFEYMLPGGALATFTWPSRELDDGRELLDAYGMTATASNPAGAANAVDDDATTRWTTGASQEPGQYLQVDLGRPQRVRRVVLDTGADTGDFPRGYQLLTSLDGERWREAAAGNGSGQLTVIDFGTTAGRFLRVVQTGSAPQWWSVADLRVYR